MNLPESSPLLRYQHQMRSRYSETDKMGYVYYGVYLEYFEVARTEMVRSMGINYAELENQGVMLPVVEAELNYRRPVFYDEKMWIEVLIYEEPMVRLSTYYRVLTRRGEGSHVLGKVTLAFMDRETRRPIRAPQSFMESFRKATE